MINLTPLARPLLAGRERRARASQGGLIEAAQRRVLRQLLRRARHCQWVKQHMGAGAEAATYEQFAAAIPVAAYEDLRPAVMRMVHGEPDVLWPGRVSRFAQSSGTSDGRSKFIPITTEGLQANHYAGSSVAVARYLQAFPHSRLFGGKAFILGGSFATDLTDLPAGVKVGDLSAHLIEAINPAVNLFRVPDKRTALMPDWEEKLPRLVEASVGQNITNISGVPSWFMTVLQRVIERAGASTIHEVWPNLEVFFHGGISFEPYRQQYAALTDPQRMRYLETYNASEGFFAVQDDPYAQGPGPHPMQLLLDVGVFYEFVPLDGDGAAAPVPAWQVQAGKTYALVITTCNGLWRYPIGDTVLVHSTDPLTITIAGRTKSFINAFGEELMVHNAEAAMAVATEACRCSVANYTAAPVYAANGKRGHHQWLIEFTQAPADLDAFAQTLDQALQDVNSDYAAKRAHGIFLDPLSITVAQPGLFDRWLASTGKLGGQRKVPRLANDRKIIEQMLALNAQ